MSASAQEAESAELIFDDARTELASNRTSLSFERTRMSADRTLMATVRTSLSLISFGFTIHEVFSRASRLFPNSGVDASARRLGLALLAMGVLMLAMGIVTHSLFDHQLGVRRDRLYNLHLLRRAVRYHGTPTYVIAVMLLIVGLLAIADIAFRLF
jgi:putative membrane protein